MEHERDMREKHTHHIGGQIRPDNVRIIDILPEFLMMQLALK